MCAVFSETLAVRRRCSTRTRALIAASLFLAPLFPSSHLLGQPSPERVAERFFHHLGRLQWQEVSAVVHPSVWADFDRIAHQLAMSPRGDRVLAELYGAPLQELESWSDSETFVRSLEGLTRYARGLMESQVASTVQLLGAVPEGDSISHVLYRQVTDHMGVQTEGVSVVSLKRSAESWLVAADGELDVLKTAFRGVPIAREPPPAP